MSVADVVAFVRRKLDHLTDYDRRLRERWVADWANQLDAGAWILDAGAGDGHMAASFRNQHYLAIDIRPRRSRRRIRMCCGDLHNLPFRDATIDHVVSIQVLEHVHDPRQVICEIARVLRPGGSACLSVPQSDPEHEQPHDFFRFTTFSLQMLAEASHLEIAHLRKKGGYFRRLSAELRDLPFVVLPENRPYRMPVLAGLVRILLVVAFTFVGSTALLFLDGFDKLGNYTTGYFCIMRKPA
jgi:SAM-dependent methyltransferase